LHSHLNVDIEAGYLPEGQLKAIRDGWAGILGVDKAVVNYSYTDVVPKMVHVLKYITRATFRDYTWDERMACELYNFRNMRSWGSWKGEPVWELEGEAELEPIAELEAGRCPVCGEPVAWGKPLPVGLLDMADKIPIGAGYYRLADLPPPRGLPEDVKFRLYWMELNHQEEVQVAMERARREAAIEAEYQAILWQELVN